MKALKMLKEIESEQVDLRMAIHERIHHYQKIINQKPASFKAWKKAYKFRKKVKQDYKTALLIKEVMNY